MIESGTLLQNRYLIEKQIGEGGMGAVYLAIDQRFDSPVAIKETFYKDDELGEAFEREARLLNSLHHQALPHVSDFFTENNGYFLVMQFIEGEDTFEILKREGAFPLEDVLRWTDSLLDALDYLHSQEPPIIHRDIKPQNLKITARGDVILLDFGLAKLNSEDSSGVKSVFGYTRKYSPLEQIQGTGTDARSDLFALAATAYHLLTGKPPIEVIARASEIIHGNPDPLPLANEINREIPIGVANVLHTALALNAARRFVSAKAMRQALEHAVNQISIENQEDVPQSVSALAASDEKFIKSDDEILQSPEIENFTALEAFAADAAAASPAKNSDEKSAAIENPKLEHSATLLDSEFVPQENFAVGKSAELTPRTKQFRFRLAAAAAVLLCAAFGALYFIAGTSSSNDANQTPAIQSTNESNSDAEQSAAILEAPQPETADASLSKDAEQPKTKSPSNEESFEKKEIADNPTAPIETTEKSKTASPTSESPRSVPTRQNQRIEHTRPRVADDTEPVPDIELIFTGRPTTQRDEKQRQKQTRRQQREKVSDEEWREMRRQRRQQRRQRQNGNNFPF